MYNKKEMNELPFFEDEIGRKRKRVLKENYKKTIESHARKSKYLPVNPFMEDFHYLQGYSKSGVAPQANKKTQPPSGYKHLFSQARLDSHYSHYLEKVHSSKHQAQTRKQLARTLNA